MNALVDVLYEDFVGNPNFTEKNNPFSPNSNLNRDPVVRFTDIVPDLYDSFCQQYDIDEVVRQNTEFEKELRKQGYETTWSYEEICWTKLCWDRSAQRDQAPKHINNIARTWDSRRDDILTVFLNAEGQYLVQDGQQHTFANIIRNKCKPFTVRCKVYKYQPADYPIQLFLGENGDWKKDIRQYDTIRLKVLNVRMYDSQDTSSVDYAKRISILEKYNMRFQPEGADDWCGVSHTNIFDTTEKALDKFCETYADNFPTHRPIEQNFRLFSFFEKLDLLDEQAVIDGWVSLMKDIGGPGATKSVLHEYQKAEFASRGYSTPAKWNPSNGIDMQAYMIWARGCKEIDISSISQPEYCRRMWEGTTFFSGAEKRYGV